jgi:hypothetical protein
MKTQEALDLIREKYGKVYNYLADLTVLCWNAKKMGRRCDAERYSSKIRGSLDTLARLGILDNFGRCGLYLYFVDENEINREARS